MTDPTSPHEFGLSGSPDDELLVHFPPDLGLVPPRELARVPRPRRDGVLVE